MFWYILISLVLLFLLWLLLVPVILYTDTTQNSYVLTLPGIIHLRVVPTGTFFYIRAWIFCLPFRINPLKARKEKEKEKKKKTRRLPLKTGALKAVLGAVRIRKLEMDLDTDDYSLNAWLIPAFSAVNGGNIRMQVNFEGRADLVLDLRTRIGSLIWTYSKYRYQLITNR
jgi:hypothetical protein